jgi:hypothetical protein
MSRLRAVAPLLAAAGLLVPASAAAAAAAHPAVTGCTAGKVATAALTINPSTVKPGQATTTTVSVTNCTAKSLPVKITGTLVPPKGCGKTKEQTIGAFTLAPRGVRKSGSTSHAPSCLGRYTFTMGVVSNGKTVAAVTRTLTVQNPKP